MPRVRTNENLGKRYGVFECPCHWNFENATVETFLQGESMIYRRQLGDEHIQIMCSAKRKLRIQPMEPVQTPKHLTPNMLIEFENRVLVMPDDRLRLDLTFPLEIGVLIPRQGSWQLLDVFAFAPQKFSLFGDPASGYLCKYWKSRWLNSPDDLSLNSEGWLRLDIRNTTSKPVEVSRVACSGHQMLVYHDGERSCCCLTMKVTARNMAEVEGETKVPLRGAEKTFDIFEEKTLLGVSQRFVMEGNL